jgi:hypothetical protein
MQPASRVGTGDQTEEVEELGMPLPGMAGIGHLAGGSKLRVGGGLERLGLR